MSRKHPRGWWTAVGSMAAALLVVAPASVAAQESFADVQSILRTGDTVFVTDDGGMEWRGRVIDVGPSVLRLTVDGAEHAWPAATVQQVQRRGDSVKNGVIVGLVTGGVLATLPALQVAAFGYGRDALLLIGGTMGIGASVGATVDALIPGRTLIYDRPPRQPAAPPTQATQVPAAPVAHVPSRGVRTPNAVFFEVLGNGGLYSLNYERKVAEALSVRIGFGTWAADDFWGSGTTTRVQTVPWTINVLPGRGRHRFEAGAGLLAGRRQQSYEPEFGRRPETSSFLSLTSTVGYRYQKPEGGLIFRAGLSPFYGLDDESVAYPEKGFFPSFGVSVGFGF